MTSAALDLGAPVTAIGLFGTCQNFLDGVSQYPGGWIRDPDGHRRALLPSVTLARSGTCAINVADIGAPSFGMLVAVQAVTSIVSYIPAARMADRIGRKRIPHASGVRPLGDPVAGFGHERARVVAPAVADLQVPQAFTGATVPARPAAVSSVASGHTPATAFAAGGAPYATTRARHPE